MQHADFSGHSTLEQQRKTTYKHNPSAAVAVSASSLRFLALPVLPSLSGRPFSAVFFMLFGVEGLEGLGMVRDPPKMTQWYLGSSWVISGSLHLGSHLVMTTGNVHLHSFQLFPMMLDGKYCGRTVCAGSPPSNSKCASEASGRVPGR